MQIVAALLGLFVASWHGATALKHTAVRAEGTVTPVEKVISLLEKLSAQVAEEGKKEAAEYDKFACFCKENADGKLYAITKSQEKIDELTAEIASLDAEITQLNSDIQKLGEEMVDLANQIGNATETRNGEHSEYLVDEDDMKTAIAQLEGAIEALKSSKGSMIGNVKLDGSLVQLRGLAKNVLQFVSKLPKSAAVEKQVATLSALVQSSATPGVSASYEYHSNSIIETLEGLLFQFKANLKDLDEGEFRLQSAFELSTQNLANVRKFKGQEKDEKSALSASKSEERSAKDESKTQETAEMNADKSFLAVLEQQCEDRAVEWDGRSKSRAAELKAIAEATDILKKGVAPNWSANKKLADIAVSKRQVTASGKNQRQLRGAASFLQIQNEDGTAAKAAVTRALKHLQKRGAELHSPVLSGLAVKAALSEDHFVKVRGLIKDLIARLEADAASEQTQKEYCDQQMTAEMSNRDTAALEKEEQSTIMAEKTALKESLMAEIKELSEEVAELRKALAEMTELRANEHADNMETIAKATEGKEAVDDAIEVLKAYYGPDFLQKSGYVPPNADRQGLTVDDRAPAMSYSGEYHGAQEESTNILAILQIISDDFDRTVGTVTAAEAMSDSEFKAYELATNKDISDKEDDISTKEKEVADAEADHVAAQEAYNGADKDHASAIKALDSLKAMCVEGEETWEQRAKAREEEVEALKQALKILDEWQS
eukprot:CAMPEP_0178439640 /NCGR_PEP_ID=MMETSP0689_2-20121128/36271_1 /TAXON_ID=160604 /ORGANISM="Amphidinium massartii, Strain CS-259" /LENGTH=717 /DNA_ID=CAMNT_0020062197 /DNA_START=29 /DNA_END=2182 /DNA_ORIENTATION=-